MVTYMNETEAQKHSEFLIQSMKACVDFHGADWDALPEVWRSTISLRAMYLCFDVGTHGLFAGQQAVNEFYADKQLAADVAAADWAL